MEIPTRQDRIQSLYGEAIETYSVVLNKAILEDSEETDGKGCSYITTRLNADGDYVDSRVIKYLDEHYRKAGWIIEQHSDADSDKQHIRIYFLQQSVKGD